MSSDFDDLQKLEEPDLLDRILALASRAKAALATGDVAFLGRLRDGLRRAARGMDGAPLQLVEVAEAFVEAMARSDIRPAEQALLDALDVGGEAAASLLLTLARRRTMPESAARKTIGEPRLSALVESGVLDRVEGDLVLRQGYVALVTELAEPAPLRHWRIVAEIRNQVAYSGLDGSSAIALLVDRTGISDAVAANHFERFPARPTDQNLVYRRRAHRTPIWTKPGAAPIREPRPTTTGDLRAAYAAALNDVPELASAPQPKDAVFEPVTPSAELN